MGRFHAMSALCIGCIRCPVIPTVLARFFFLKHYLSPLFVSHREAFTNHLDSPHEEAPYEIAVIGSSPKSPSASTKYEVWAILDGLRLILASSYLLHVALFLWLSAVISSFYFRKVRLTASTVATPVGRSRLFAQVNSFITVLILAGQLSLTVQHILARQIGSDCIQFPLISPSSCDHVCGDKAGKIFSMLCPMRRSTEQRIKGCNPDDSCQFSKGRKPVLETLVLQLLWSIDATQEVAAISRPNPSVKRSIDFIYAGEICDDQESNDAAAISLPSATPQALDSGDKSMESPVKKNKELLKQSQRSHSLRFLVFCCYG